MSADGEGAREHSEHDVGGGGGGYIIVLRFASEEQVAYASASEVGIVAIGTQGPDDCEGGVELGRGRQHRSD